MSFRIRLYEMSPTSFLALQFGDDCGSLMIAGTTAMTDARHMIGKIRTELKPHEVYLRSGPLTFRFNSVALWP
jgi:hypothetical protein